MELLNKITLKTIGCQPKPNSVKVPADLATIYGMATSFTVGTSNYGEFTKFHGDFRALRTVDGAEFRSGALLLPPTIGDLLRSAITSAPDTGVQFAVEIGVKPSETPIGYEYVVKPLVDTDQADPLATLTAKIQALLPAPAAVKTESKGKGKKS